MEMGNPGDSRSVGQGVLEMRIDYGPGYRIYYVHRGAQIVILLCGGVATAQGTHKELMAGSTGYRETVDRGEST